MGNPAGMEHRGPTWEHLRRECRWEALVHESWGVSKARMCDLGSAPGREASMGQACAGKHGTWGATWANWGLGSRVFSLWLVAAVDVQRRSPTFRLGEPVHKCQFHQQRRCQPSWVSASFSKSPACEGWHLSWQASSAAGGPDSDCLKETKRRRAILKPVRRPQREPLSSCDCSRKARPLPSARLGPWLCKCGPPPTEPCKAQTA